jgi:hypothetical protein
MSRVKVQREPENLTRKQRRDHARARRKALEDFGHRQVGARR